MFKETKEHAVRTGLGTALCFQYENETKYHILSAVENLPSIFSAPNTIEYSSTTNMSITLLQGKRSTSQVEEVIPYNIDNIVICDNIAGKKLKYAYIDLEDFSGHEFMAQASYRVSDVDPGSPKTITVALTVYQANENVTRDLYDVYEDTVAIDEIPTTIYLKKTDTTGTEITFGLTPSTATIAIDSTETIGVNSDVSATVSSNKLTIKAGASAKVGSGIVYVKATATGYASNYRAIKVILEE